jgi:hypothetical protein
MPTSESGHLSASGQGVPFRNSYDRRYFSSIYRLVGLMVYKRSNFRPIAEAIELYGVPRETG